MTSEPTQTTAVPVDRPIDWWKSAVVYQIYPRSFADSNGDGTGDIPGILSHLDYLAQLGVDVVWLSPVYVSPMDDNGYDISDYQDVDPIFGTLEDLERLIAGLHERDIKIIMDLVVNHTSDEHPWFIESRDPDSRKRDWYWWRPPRGGFESGTEGAEPTNWESVWHGSAWEFDERSGEYYLHLFSAKQPDLNWENPEVRRAIYDMMNWWVDRGIDGFRMDVINLISKHELKDGQPLPGRTRVSCFPFTANGPRLHEFLAEMNAAVGLDERNLLTVGEMPGSTIETARRVTDPANQELNMVFTFEHVQLDMLPEGSSKFDLAPLSLPALKKNLKKWQLALADVGWNSLYWDNHDQPRAVSRFGDDSPEHRENSAKTLATVQHMHKGTPYIYQGEELGMTNTYFSSIEQYRDIESLRYHADALSLGMEVEAVLHSLSIKSRDNARTPMHWDGSSHAGFTDGIPWLPVNPNYVTINAATEMEDPNSVFHHFRKLIELRHDHPVIVDGRFELLLPDHEQIWAVTRTLDDQVLVMIANCSSESANVPGYAIPDLTGAQVLLATHGESTLLDLAPWESRIYLLG
ncbi:MAG TPA: alpha-glucosidase [Propionibacteriaceae bacterium]|nr:alpha-glucosidase [Propionibacteriaceae bacterium]